MSTVAVETDLTPAIVESVVAMTAEGRWPDRAAGELGVQKKTFDGWMEKGANDALTGVESLERDFVERIYVADCQAESEWFTGWRQRIEKGTFMAGFLAFMARRWPERYVERKPEAGAENRFEDSVRDFLAGVEAARKIDTPA